jgi:minor extracellular serine protease Vpr
MLKTRVVCMKKIVFLLFLTCCLIGVSIYPVQGSFDRKSNSHNVFIEDSVLSKQKDTTLIPVIVELSEPCVVEQSDRHVTMTSFYDMNQDFILDYSFEPSVLSQQESFLSYLDRNGISFRDTGNHCTIIANSVALDVKGTDIKHVLEYPGVSKIWSNEVRFFPSRYIAAQTTHAVDAWKGIAKNMGVEGSGVKVGVLDTGLDTTHDDFQKRVKGGYDYGDNDSNFNDRVGHGTHVAGIIGGKSLDNKFNIGIAPDVFLYIYKVFSSSSPGANTQNITKAVEQSIKDKCDVINMSLGHESGEPATSTGYYADSIRNANKTGVMVVVAASNEGSRGKKQKYAIGSPSTLDVCFSVAATDDRSELSFSATANGEKRRITAKLAQYSPSFTNKLTDTSLVDCGYGKPETIPDDVRGKIAILQRGPKNSNMTFREKMDNVRNAGAVALVIYNYKSEQLIAPAIATQDEDPSNITFIPTCLISYTDGQWLLDHANEVSLDFSQGVGSIMSTFSSQGSGSDGWFKPEIATPGTNIMSTVPKNSYAANSGTSMASPVMAGLVALLKNIHPDWSNEQIKSAFMNTADVLYNESNGLPVTFTLQGAGQARIDKAVETSAFIIPSALVVKRNEILPHQSDSQKPVQITITNALKKTMQYDIQHELFLFPGEVSPVDVSINVEKLSLNQNEKKSISVSFQCDYASMSRPRYEGVIYVGDQHIPFIVYRDSPSSNVEALSDIQITPEELIFTDEETTEDVLIQFTLNSGIEQNWEGFSGGCAYSNYGNISIRIMDEYGEEWGTIATLSNLLIGDYQLQWNGKDASGKYILAKGKYHIEILVTNWKYSGGSLQYYQESYSSQQKMNVVKSVVPEPGNLIVAVQKVLSPGKYFSVDIVLEEADDVVGIEYEFSYNGDKLMCDGAFDGGFFSSDGADVELIEDIDDSEDGYGVVSLYRYAKKDQEEGISGKHVKISSLSFKPLDSGRMSIDLLNCQLIYTNGDKARLRYRGGSFVISRDYDFLLCDLNNDRVVDMYDWRIFKDHYLTAKGDENYNKDCDFNQDERIDIEDLIIFGREYRRML